MDISNERFSYIVNRELHNIATEEEKAFLWSSRDVIQRWRGSLRDSVVRVEGAIGRAKTDLIEKQQEFIAKGYGSKEIRAEWFDCEAEAERKIAARKFVLAQCRLRLASINQWEKEHPLERQIFKLPESEQKIARRKAHRSGYCEGWIDALKRIQALIDNGASWQEAYSICQTQHDEELQSWKEGEDFVKEKES